MSAAAVPQPQPRRREFLPWLGHRAWWLTSVLVLVFLGAALAITVLARGQGEVPISVVWTVAVAYLVIYAGLLAFQLRHDMRLCEECIDDAPSDPQAELDKRRNCLAIGLWHLTNDWRMRFYRSRHVALSLVPIVGQLLVTAAAALVVLILLPEMAATLVLSAALVVGTPLFAAVEHTHRRLYPWCPRCRDNGNGWEDQGAPEPSPTLKTTVTT